MKYVRTAVVKFSMDLCECDHLLNMVTNILYVPSVWMARSFTLIPISWWIIMPEKLKQAIVCALCLLKARLGQHTTIYFQGWFKKKKKIHFWCSAYHTFISQTLAKNNHNPQLDSIVSSLSTDMALRGLRQIRGHQRDRRCSKTVWGNRMSDACWRQDPVFPQSY